jgi:hypothetical protein
LDADCCNGPQSLIQGAVLPSKYSLKGQVTSFSSSERGEREKERERERERGRETERQRKEEKGREKKKKKKKRKKRSFNSSPLTNRWIVIAAYCRIQILFTAR